MTALNLRGDGADPFRNQADRLKNSLRMWVTGGWLLAIAIFLLAVVFPVWFWYWWRIEPRNGEFAVLIRKTGENLPPGEILALKPGQKGIYLDVLPEGRYFRNPYTWIWEIGKITDIPAGRLGLLTRLYGSELPSGEILALKPEQKGILPDILRPGKHRINPYACDVLVVNAQHIRPGNVGVVTSLVGKDVLHDILPQDQQNQFLVTSGLKGVLPEVLDPGTYYLNPYMVSVVEVNLQSQRFEMSGGDAITFLTQDGFIVRVEGTIEFNLQREKAALLTQQVGDMDDIIKKLIIPRARGFMRIEGSKKPAVSFIGGETRQVFQDNLEKHLKENCKPWGISINSALIRNIIPPEEIASVIREREIAAQNVKKFEQQLEKAKSAAELARQEMLAEQNRKKVEAETSRMKAGIAAKQAQSVKTTAATQELEVAKIDNEAAKAQAQALILDAEAQRDVIKMTNEAEAKVLADQSSAFSGGMEFARFNYYSKLAPQLQGILAGDQPGGAGMPFLIPPRIASGPPPVSVSGSVAASTPVPVAAPIKEVTP